MEVSLSKTSFRCYDNICTQKLKKEASQDAVVPDTMPDIAEIMDCCGCFVIRSKDMNDGVIKITGTMTANALYRSEENGELCSMEVNVPVEFSSECEAGDEAECVADIVITSLDAKMLNPRKVLVKAELTAELNCYQSGQMEFTDRLADGVENIYIQQKSVPFSPIVAVREKTFVLTDELVLSGGQAPVGEILAKTLQMVVEDVKNVGSKLVFKGSVKCSVLYRSSDGLPVTGEFVTNVSQIMECDAALTNATVQLTLLPTGIYLELPASGDGRTLQLEVHMLAQAVARERTELRYLADAYSNTYPLELHCEERDVCCVIGESMAKALLREVYETPLAVQDVIASRVSGGVPELTAEGVILPVCVHLLYATAGGEMHAARKKYQLHFSVERGEGEYINVADYDFTELYVVPVSGGVEIRLHAQMQLKRGLRNMIAMVSAIERGEDVMDVSSLPSLVIIKGNESSDLWRLAKENCSTVEQIEDVNGLKEMEGIWEKFLLIPKSR